MISSVIAGLGGCLLVVVVAQAYLWLQRRFAPWAPYAGYAAVRRVQGGHEVLLLCEGWCPGRTRHEDNGAGTATCTGCGIPRSTATELDGP